jgi:UMF1 family MFS transporter
VGGTSLRGRWQEIFVRLLRKPVVAWALFDWANSAFATTVMVGFFPLFFKQYWAAGASVSESTFELGLINGAASFVIAVLAPFLGAVADRSGGRVKLLGVFTLVGALATAALALIGKGEWAAAAAVFALASLGFSAANAFYDSLLLDVAERSEFDRASAFGYALGYLGGGVLFALNVWMTLSPSTFGISSAGAAVQWAFVSVGVWWLLFSLPGLLIVRERRVRPVVPWRVAMREALAELWTTTHEISRYRVLALFLLAYWLYIDGVNTVAKMSVDYGMSLGFPTDALIKALLITQFVSFPAALMFGWLGTRIGARDGVLVAIAIYIVATFGAFRMEEVADFYWLAATVGCVQGGVQALSRSYFGSLVPPGRQGEFFGFYNMMGKFAAVLGPVLVGVTALFSASPRMAILSIEVLFVAGGVLLIQVGRLARK